MSSENHKMEIRPFAGHVRVMTAGYMIAETDNAVELREADYPTVYYIPKSDIRMVAFTPSATSTVCPHKGTATYWNIDAGNVHIDDAAWSYERPLEQAAAITGHLAFSPEKIDAIESTSAGPA